MVKEILTGSTYGNPVSSCEQPVIYYSPVSLVLELLEETGFAQLHSRARQQHIYSLISVSQGAIKYR